MFPQIYYFNYWMALFDKITGAWVDAGPHGNNPELFGAIHALIGLEMSKNSNLKNASEIQLNYLKSVQAYVDGQKALLAGK